MNLAIFGASGKTGQVLLNLALDQGSSVVALARNPAKITRRDEALSLIQGEIQEPGAVERTIAGVDAVISVLGPTRGQAPTAISRGLQNILVAMDNQGVRRLILSAGAGVRDSHDRPTFMDQAISLLLKLTARPMYEDMLQAVALVRSSDLDWTVVRVPMLTDDPPATKIVAGYLGQGPGFRLARADLAAFMLKQVTSTEFLRQAPVISSAA